MKNETICALSTAPGIGGIAVIRVSGPQAFEIVAAVFDRDFSKVRSHSLVHGWVISGEERIDEVLLGVMRGPRTFTGEDTVEISCHGSSYIQQRIIEVLLEAGAVLAKPGEFTMRAFLNGKMDLSQAEAVADLIASESAAGHRQALHQMRGGFSKEINGLRDQLIHFASLVELELDFAEEDVEFANRPQLKQLVQEIQRVVHHLRDSFALGNAIKNGVPVAIIGAPNMGKSTLLNALLNEERAIVSEIAGTTRDTIEDHITIHGVRFKFIDTAGIRHTQDSIEKLGIERSFVKAKEASIILLLFDAVETHRADLALFVEEVRREAGDDKHLLLIANKMDKPGFDAIKVAEMAKEYGEVMTVSAKNKVHIDELKRALADAVNLGKVDSGETIVTNVRHYEALKLASTSLDDVMGGLNSGISGDFLAIDIRKTLYHLGEITGQISADDLLHSIFSKFCIGK